MGILRYIYVKFILCYATIEENDDTDISIIKKVAYLNKKFAKCIKNGSYKKLNIYKYTDFVSKIDNMLVDTVLIEDLVQKILLIYYYQMIVISRSDVPNMNINKFLNFPYILKYIIDKKSYVDTSLYGFNYYNNCCKFSSSFSINKDHNIDYSFEDIYEIVKVNLNSHKLS